MKTLEERVRDEVGSEANPAYLEQILGRNNRGLLEWLLDQSHTLANQTVPESLAYADDESRRPTLELGTRIMTTDLRQMLFVVGELRARLTALAPKSSPE